MASPLALAARAEAMDQREVATSGAQVARPAAPPGMVRSRRCTCEKMAADAFRSVLIFSSRLCNMSGAPRLTIGHVPDCVHGYEFSFTGAFEWDREGVQVDPAGGIGTLLFAVPPVDPAGLSAFSNATAKAQYYKTQYWSIEMSNTNVGWDIMKLVCGFRYINYDENFTVISQNVANEVGLLRSDIKNQMLGYQLGLDLLYPVCHNTYTDFRARAGFYANFIDLNFQVLNAGSTTVLMLDDAIDIAGQFEFGSGIRYQCNDGLSFRTGFELWYLTGLATAKNQFSNGIVASQTVRASDDFFVAGLSFGAEYRY